MMTYKDIFGSYSFVSFDISVRSTGWCKYQNGVLTCGSFGLESKDELHRRMEFRQRAIEIIDNQTYDFIAIEDVIGGCNFETTKALVQLNSIVDDLIYLKVVPNNVVQRIGNTVWKKYLKDISGYRGLKASYGKDEIHQSIQILGFNDDVVQDIYDSIGIAVGVALQLKQPVILKTKAKIRTDLTKSYNFYEYTDDKLLYYTNSTCLSEMVIDYDGTCRDMILQFKKVVTDIGDDYIFVLDAPREKYGVLALTNKLPMRNNDNRIIAVKKTVKIK